MPKNIVKALIPVAFLAQALAQTPAPSSDFGPAQKQFNSLCEGCHGEGGAGGDRAPALVNNRVLRTRTESQIAELIKNGTRGGMPAFNLPDSDLQPLAGWLRSLNVSAFDSKPSGEVHAGEEFFFGKGQCSNCHMVQGRGKVNGPDLSDIGHKSTVRELELVLQDPTPQMGIHTTTTCPPWAFCPDETWGVVNVKMRNGQSLRGFARGRAEHDLELQTFDGRMHFLTDKEYLEIAREKTSYMPPLKATAEERLNVVAYLSSLGGERVGAITGVEGPIPSDAMKAVMSPKPGEWPTYNGTLAGNRYGALDQINAGNVQNLQVAWVYPLSASGLETTPVVSDGFMYVTAPDQVCALAAATGRELWCYTRAEASGNGGARRNSGLPNRGVGLLGDRVFFATTDAHLICLNRLTGGLMWDVKMPESPGRYMASSAPLVIGDLVIGGIAGGDGPLRGFLAAYKATTGEQVWRFWTVPKRGEPGSETWTGDAIETGGGATWLTGSYDVETGILYWTAGNPFPATDGDERKGSNLYTNCVVALDAKTGKLRWHYQFTPHDLHDWDATEPLVLVDTNYRGRPKKTAAPGKSQWLCLCARPDQRRVPVCQAVREKDELGQRFWFRRETATPAC